MKINIEDDDLLYAAKRTIRTAQPDFVWDNWTYSSLGADRFKQEGIFSVALESAVARRLGLPRKAIDDTMTDLPNVEVASCAADNWNGRPYFVSRKVNPKDHDSRYFLPTLTGFRVPSHERVVELRFFIEPAMKERLRFFKAFKKDSGITRWLIVPETAIALGADVDIWFRLEQAVRATPQIVVPPVPQLAKGMPMTASALTRAILGK